MTILLPTFCLLMNELRIKLDITKDGIGPDKTINEVYFGLDLETHDPEEIAENEALIKERRERVILKEFNFINMNKIHEALEEAQEKGAPPP